MQSTLRFRRDLSKLFFICLGLYHSLYGPLSHPNFVAIKISFLGILLQLLPMIVSDFPSPYTSAVSQWLIPTSQAFLRVFSEFSLVCPLQPTENFPLMLSPPKAHVPRLIAETSQFVLPNTIFLICILLK